VGRYCPTGSGRPVACQPGYYTNYTQADVCIVCPAGFYCVPEDVVEGIISHRINVYYFLQDVHFNLMTFRQEWPKLCQCVIKQHSFIHPSIHLQTGICQRLLMMRRKGRILETLKLYSSSPILRITDLCKKKTFIVVYTKSKYCTMNL